MDLELGIDTFGDVTLDSDGTLVSHAQVIRNVVDEAVLAEQSGLDVFGIGEHHRDDFAISSPEMVLAGIATRTERLRLASAVTVLSSDDPVRVFERFSTLDALSRGRAEVILGRGSFTESFPLFGFDLANYQELFEEKLAMFVELRKQGPVSWEGTLTQSLHGVAVFPPVENAPLPTWVAVGGSPESVIRAASHGHGRYGSWTRRTGRSTARRPPRPWRPHDRSCGSPLGPSAAQAAPTLGGTARRKARTGRRGRR